MKVRLRSKPSLEFKSGPQPVFYILLNKAIDIAVDGLERQGKTLENPTREVTVMLITHCPDAELSLVFSCRPLGPHV